MTRRAICHVCMGYEVPSGYKLCPACAEIAESIAEDKAKTERIMDSLDEKNEIIEALGQRLIAVKGDACKWSKVMALLDKHRAEARELQKQLERE